MFVGTWKLGLAFTWIKHVAIKACKVIIVLLGVAVLLSEWDYDLNGFIEPGCRGRRLLWRPKALANLFGGLVIITDKPFSIELVQTHRKEW